MCLITLILALSKEKDPASVFLKGRIYYNIGKNKLNEKFLVKLVMSLKCGSLIGMDPRKE